MASVGTSYPDVPPAGAAILTVTEVAEFLRVAPKTVYGLIKRGQLRAFKVGRVVRCYREEVLRFVEEQTSEAPQIAVPSHPKDEK